MADAVHHRKMGYDAGRIMEMGNYLVWGFHGDSKDMAFWVDRETMRLLIPISTFWLRGGWTDRESEVVACI